MSTIYKEMDTSMRNKKCWTSQLPQVATKENIQQRWGGAPNGKNFRCYLCGYKFNEGDYWRFVWATHVGFCNFMTCKNCDGEDVLDRWVAANREAKERFWWFTKE